MSAATIGTVLDFEQRSEAGIQWAEVKVDLGGEDPVTAIYYPPAGFDEWPLPGDSALLVDGPGSGLWYCVGFRDPKLPPPASGEGETVFYSRSAPGVIAAKLTLKTDGSVDLNDGAAVLGADGVLTVAADVVGGGKSLKTHIHPAGTLLDSVAGTVTGATGSPS